MPRKDDRPRRLVAKFYNRILTAKFGKNALPGFRTGPQVIKRVRQALTAYKLVKLLPDIYKAISRTDFNELALDVDDIVGLRPCVDGLVNALG
jgi:hypothetical protein